MGPQGPAGGLPLAKLLARTATRSASTTPPAAISPCPSSRCWRTSTWPAPVASAASS
ncbi:hypothetical protein NKH77_11020 [Streptomyces sp. M19]